MRPANTLILLIKTSAHFFVQIEKTFDILAYFGQKKGVWQHKCGKLSEVLKNRVIVCNSAIFYMNLRLKERTSTFLSPFSSLMTEKTRTPNSGLSEESNNESCGRIILAGAAL